MKSYDPGDTVYLVESNQFIRPVTILQRYADLYTISFPERGGAIRVKASRLFPNDQEAKNSIPNRKKRSSVLPEAAEKNRGQTFQSFFENTSYAIPYFH